MLFRSREALEALAVRLGGPPVRREELEGFEALKRRDVRRAERLMTLHVRRVRDAIFRLVD